VPSLNELRADEFDDVKDYFRPGLRILEIGGGIGYQASLIAAKGAIVDSIDIVETPPNVQAYFPVRVYDGRNIPFPDEHFDVVFSSNVLEHIPHLDAALSEIRRVMKADGLAIHILPTPTWRTWTSMTHYVHIARRTFGLLFGGSGQKSESLSESLSAGLDGLGSTAGGRRMLKRLFGDGPHGEYPSALSELWYFSRRRWTSLFQKKGFQVVETRPSNIFYTGYGVFPSVSMEKRRVLARFLGSATRIYILRKAP
jgi:SAM-dependent methyltransferase